MTVRQDSHAGSWYTDNPIQLDSQLVKWLTAAGSQPTDPVAGLKAIIAPQVYLRSHPVYFVSYASLSKTCWLLLLGPNRSSRLPIDRPVSIVRHNNLQLFIISPCSGYFSCAAHVFLFWGLHTIITWTVALYLHAQSITRLWASFRLTKLVGVVLFK